MKRPGRRIEFILAIVLVLFALSFPAYAADKTIGVIVTGNIPYYKEILKAFSETLPSEGFGPGKAEIIQQTPTPEAMSWVNAARKLIAVGADVIVSFGAPATLAVTSETSDIPVVFAGVYDPQAMGLAKKNATGMSSKVPVSTLIKNLKSLSDFTKLGIVYSSDEKDTVLQANDVKNLEGSMGFTSTRFNIKKSDDIAKIASVDALFLTTGCAAMHCVTNILASARKSKIPTATTIGGAENSGVILTISADPQEQGKAAARIVGKVLKGASPSSIPVEQPKKIEMILNLKEATAMGLKVPIDLLTSATRVIK